LVRNDRTIQLHNHESLASAQERRRIVRHGSASRQISDDRIEETTMKYMITWKVPPEHYKAGVKRFLKTGGATPKGLKSLGRWHAPGSTTGWHLVEGTDVALAENAVKWADLLEIEITPVVEDDVAAAAAKKVYGS
jgi:hypothetical protein